jgi:hypothetical protein
MINGLVSIRKREDSNQDKGELTHNVHNIGKVPVKLPDMQVRTMNNRY